MKLENKIIAAFMGESLEIQVNIPFLYHKEDGIETYEDAKEEARGELDRYGSYEFEVYELRYDNDWNLLMKVVSKISRDERWIGDEYREQLLDILPYGWIDEVYECVVKFIQNLNSTKNA